MPQNLVSIHRSNDSQLGKDVRELGMCRVELRAMRSVDQQAGTQPEEVERVSELHFRIDPCPG